VVVVDPGVGVQGEPLDEPCAAETAKLVREQGGIAVSSTASVTDPAAVADLFARVVEEHGSIDAVVNTAGILRFGGAAEASQDDWDEVCGVHFDGYRNVLRAVLPYMVSAGYGRVVGFTSGVGLARTVADSPAYGCAKRAVASLTWQLGRLVPDGISINALSPIAATRMVRQSLIASGASPKGLDLSAMPQPEEMGPAAAYLAGEGFGWSRGHVVFSAGSELSLIGPPRLLEAVRTRDAANLGRALDTVFPAVLTPVEAGQMTTGGTNPRFGAIFDEGPATGFVGAPGAPGSHCLVVADNPHTAELLERALSAWGMGVLGVGSWKPFNRAAASLPHDFGTASDMVARAAQSVECLVGVIVAVGAEEGPSASDTPWSQLIDAHAGTVPHIVSHAGWVRAGIEETARSGRALRLVHLTRAMSPAGRTAAQAVAQLARCTSDMGGAAAPASFAISVESDDTADLASAAAVAARLVAAADTPSVKGAELVIRPGWLGLRSHPGPLCTVSFGGPDIPEWVDGALKDCVDDYR
jgi:NAD(P)-dependent dehydrogenase (short-subunit alcohol dehydrogenase family)